MHPNQSVVSVPTPGGINGQESVIYYWHADGTISTVSFDRAGAELARQSGIPGGPAGVASTFAVVPLAEGGYRIVVDDPGLGRPVTITYAADGSETDRNPPVLPVARGQVAEPRRKP
jgi:hypothetical protein